MIEKYSDLKDSLQLIKEISKTPMNLNILKVQRGKIEKLISEREKKVEISGHEILIINDNPEINFESYIKIIENTLNKISEIHPKIIKSIQVIKLTDEKKEEIKEKDYEEQVKKGIINGPNARRWGISSEEIQLNARAFINIEPRHIRDNRDIQPTNNISHFEFILAHECFHELKNLSQFSEEDNTNNSNNFTWMNNGNNERSLTFNGFLKSKNFNIFFDKNGDLKQNYIFHGAEIKYINNENGDPVKCFFNKNSKIINPEQTILFPERMLTNYTRNQSKNNSEEDFCDAMVLYTFDPDFLKQFDKLHGTKKFEFLEERW